MTRTNRIQQSERQRFFMGLGFLLLLIIVKIVQV